MIEILHIHLDSKLIERISAFFPYKKYKTHSPLFYEGQIPISGYLILTGSVLISNKKKYRKILASGSLIGLKELLNKKSSSINAEVFPETEMLYLDISSITEFKEKAAPELIALFKGLLEVEK